MARELRCGQRSADPAVMSQLLHAARADAVDGKQFTDF
jgi:hypothetical protein